MSEHDQFPSTSNESSSTDHVMKAWLLDPTGHDYGNSVTELIEMERRVPVFVSVDKSLRAKVIDACGMTCTFCHNEGTPVAADAKLLERGMDTAKGSGRVSVFSATNGVNFLPGRMKASETLTHALRTLRQSLGLEELHLTGGEPTLNTDLAQIIAAAAQEGYEVKMTSNGEAGALRMSSLALAGLRKINFSIFGTTPEELVSVQHDKFGDVNAATRKITALHRSIEAARENGVEVAANIVVPGVEHHDRLYRILNEFDPNLEVRLLPDLDVNNSSYYAIYKFLSDLGAKPIDAQVEAGSSNARVRYALPTGRIVTYKQIRSVKLPRSCNGCEFNTDELCKEGFYGIRLYVDDEGEYKVGICIQRMDLTLDLDKFAQSPIIDEINTLKDAEYTDLIRAYRR